MNDDSIVWGGAADSVPSFVVGIGASAGGLEAIERLFKAMPVGTGAAFVVVQHLSPDFRSFMPELLARTTSMEIRVAEDGMALAPDTIYTLPPGKSVGFDQVRLLLRDISRPSHQQITEFFQALADAFGERCAAIVLSGAGSDGSRGIADVRDAGGLVLVQDDDSARFEGMPRSAAQTGLADFVVAPELMPKLLVEHVQAGPALSDGNPGPGSAATRRLFERLDEAFGVDFSDYKPSTITRRIARRAAVSGLGSVAAYAARAAEDSLELDALFHELVIGVTEFFRDADAVAALRRALPELLAQVPEGREFRAWVPGCSTGEEAYSLVMLLLEECERSGLAPRFRVFATDVNRASLQHASEGLYARASFATVPPEWVDKYFVEDGTQLRVRPELRKPILFAPHNLLVDPPLTRLDVVSCRNLLIYLTPSAQGRALENCLFALRQGGVLVLGASESVGSLGDDFEALHPGTRIFRKVTSRAHIRRAGGAVPFAGARGLPARTVTPSRSEPRLASAYEVLLRRFMPPGLLLDEQRHLLHVFGDVSPYLALGEGPVSLDVVQLMARPFRPALLSGLVVAAREQTRVSCGVLQFSTPHGARSVEITVEPIGDGSGPTTYLALFHDMAVVEPNTSGVVLNLDHELQNRLHELESELAHTRGSLQHTVEQLEGANEELQSTNEELHSANEELQAANEELHSVNEELTSVSDEREQRIVDLDRVAANLRHLMRETDVGMVFTDPAGAIRLFTPMASTFFNLLPQDIGRPLEHITTRLPGDQVFEVLQRVRATGVAEETRLQMPDGSIFLRRVKPYRDSTSELGGVLVAFVDVTRLDHVERDLRALNEELEARVAEGVGALAANEARLRFLSEQGTDGFIDIDFGMRTVRHGLAAQRLFGVPGEMSLDLLDREVHPDDLPALIMRRDLSFSRGEPMVAAFRRKDASGAWRWVKLRAALLNPGRAIGSFTDIDAEKRAEESLAASEQRLRFVAEDASDGYFELDLATGSYRVSPGLQRLTGLGPTARFGDMRPRIHPDDVASVYDSLDRALKDRGRFSVQCRFNHRDEWRWVLLRGMTLTDAHGKAAHLVGTVTDMDAVKRAEAEVKRLTDSLEEKIRLRTAELAEREALLHTLVESLPDGVLLVDERGGVELANARVCEILGVTRRELTNVAVFLPERMRLLHGDLVSAYVHEGTARRMGGDRVIDAQRLDGQPLKLEVGLAPVTLQGKRRVIARVSDVSSRAAAEERLRRSEARFRKSFRGASIGKAILDASRRIVEANAAFCALLQFDEDELRGRLLDELVTATLASPGRIVDVRLASGSGWRELPMKRKDGSSLWTRVSEVRLKDGDEGDSTAQTIVLVENIDELRAAQQREHKMQDELREAAKLESLGVLAGGIAHDFNNILTGILGNAQLAQGSLDSGRDDVGESLEQIVVACRRAADLCSQMLAYSGKGAFVLTDTDLSWMVRDTERLVRAATPKTVVFNLSGLSAGLPPVRVDRGQIQQVIMNLAINAAEATGDAGGEVTLSTGLAPAHFLEAGTSDVPWVYLEVRDRGGGITPENLARIFEPFFTTKAKGRGLGLAAAQGIVKGHKGRLWAESKPSEGTTFRLLLPCSGTAPLPAPVSPSSAPRAPAPTATATVLLVEDEPAVRRMLERVLHSRGYVVDTAENGQIGYELFRDAPNRYGVVLLDLTMPVLDGTRTFRRIRELKPDARVILMSGYSEANSTHALEGLAGFLKKPIDRDDLLGG